MVNRKTTGERQKVVNKEEKNKKTTGKNMKSLVGKHTKNTDKKGKESDIKTVTRQQENHQKTR